MRWFPPSTDNQEEESEFQDDFLMSLATEMVCPGVIAVIQANDEYNSYCLILSLTEPIVSKEDVFQILSVIPSPLEQKSLRDTAMSLLRLSSKAV